MRGGPRKHISHAAFPFQTRQLMRDGGDRIVGAGGSDPGAWRAQPFTGVSPQLAKRVGRFRVWFIIPPGGAIASSLRPTPEP